MAADHPDDEIDEVPTYVPARWDDWSDAQKRHWLRESMTRLELYQTVANLAEFPPRDSVQRDARLTRGELAWLVVVLAQCEHVNADSIITREV